jgi:translation initiation factor IF-2
MIAVICEVPRSHPNTQTPTRNSHTTNNTHPYIYTLNPSTQGSKKYAVILAFDVPVSKEAREMAAEYNVRVFTADIIYHLFDQVGDTGVNCDV